MSEARPKVRLLGEANLKKVCDWVDEWPEGSNKLAAAFNAACLAVAEVMELNDGDALLERAFELRDLIGRAILREIKKEVHAPPVPTPTYRTLRTVEVGPGGEKVSERRVVVL